jgi:hypothetical protein
MQCYRIVRSALEKGMAACGIVSKKDYEYLRNEYVPFIEEISKETGIDEETIWHNIPRNDIKPMFRFKEGTQQRKEVKEYIVKTLKSNKRPTLKTIENKLGLRSEEKRMRNPDAIKIEVPRQIILTEKKGTGISSKVSDFKLLLGSPGYIQKWKDFAERHGIDNEYSALIYVTTQLDKL